MTMTTDSIERRQGFGAWGWVGNAARVAGRRWGNDEDIVQTAAAVSPEAVDAESVGQHEAEVIEGPAAGQAADTDAEAPETEDTTAAAQDAEDEEPATEAGDSGEDSG